jgi:hypothetical protein
MSFVPKRLRNAAAAAGMSVDDYRAKLAAEAEAESSAAAPRETVAERHSPRHRTRSARNRGLRRGEATRDQTRRVRFGSRRRVIDPNSAAAKNERHPEKVNKSPGYRSTSRGLNTESHKQKVRRESLGRLTRKAHATPRIAAAAAAIGRQPTLTAKNEEAVRLQMNE